MGRPANPFPGENREANSYEPNPITGRQPESTLAQNIIGLNQAVEGAWYSPNNFFKQGGILSRTLNLIPIFNAGAGLHDYWFNAPQPQGLEFTFVSNFGTMPPAAAISVGASIGNFTQGWHPHSTTLHNLSSPYDRKRR